MFGQRTQGLSEKRGEALPADVKLRIRRSLLRWYDRHRRDLPWRRRGENAYAQLLAEAMLQQTQVATVIGYYERFLERFPTVTDLAGAELDEVLTRWAGLGYYRRARHLHAAAQMIVDEFGGQVPRRVDELMRLPGVGRYTAGAIASVAFGERAPVVDGNVVRVLARLFAIGDDPKATATQARFWELADALLPNRRCGDFNQAMMELGATVCLPRGPVCKACPLRAVCQGFAGGRPESFPAATRRTAVLAAQMAVAAICCGERLLFVQRPASGLWAGLWELPTEPCAPDEAVRRARDRLRKRLPGGCRLSRTSAGQVERLLSHRRVTFHLYRGTLSRASSDKLSSSRRDGQRCRWVAPDAVQTMGISQACRAILDRLDR